MLNVVVIFFSLIAIEMAAVTALTIFVNPLAVFQHCKLHHWRSLFCPQRNRKWRSSLKPEGHWCCNEAVLKERPKIEDSSTGARAQDTFCARLRC